VTFAGKQANVTGAGSGTGAAAAERNTQSRSSVDHP
jgi:NAD(P)-dependent dehydrogenase (short-subunit alcohol dehydrogenase family)